MAIRLGNDDRIKAILEAPSNLLSDWEQGYMACLTANSGKEEFKSRVYAKVIEAVPELARVEVQFTKTA